MASSTHNDKRFEGVQNRAIEQENLEFRVVNEDERIVELSFSSETPVERWGATEILSHTRSAVQLERLNMAGCLLFNHNRDKVIGKVLKAEIKNKRGIAQVRFDDDAESDAIYNKVVSGTLRGVSVGYVVHTMKRETTGKGETLQVKYTATLWEPLEISIVSIPADISVGVGRAIAVHETHGLKMLGNQIKINQNKFRFKGGK